MAWEDYWRRKTEANPGLLAKGEIRIRTKAFEAEIKKAYLAGRDDTIDRVMELFADPDIARALRAMGRE